MFSVLKPGVTLCNRMKLLIISPAPIKSTSDKATSAITKRFRTIRLLPPTLAPRPPSLSVALRSGFED